MRTLSMITSSEYADITSGVRDLAHAIISPMPRRMRSFTETETTRALDAAVREYDEVEALLKEKDAKLRAAIIETAREASQSGNNLTITEIAHRVGWTRETVNRITTGAEVRQPRKPRQD